MAVFYREAPHLMPSSAAKRAKVKWINMPLKGERAIDFERQIETELRPLVDDAWTITTNKTGNPTYERGAAGAGD